VGPSTHQHQWSIRSTVPHRFQVQQLLQISQHTTTATGAGGDGSRIAHQHDNGAVGEEQRMGVHVDGVCTEIPEVDAHAIMLPVLDRNAIRLARMWHELVGGESSHGGGLACASRSHHHHFHSLRFHVSLCVSLSQVGEKVLVLT